MDTSSAAAEWATLQAAAGFVAHLLPSGPGNVIGNPVEPVIELTARPRTARERGEHIDPDVTGILRREMTLDQGGNALIDMRMRTCNGRSTAARTPRHREFVMTRPHRSASGASPAFRSRAAAHLMCVPARGLNRRPTPRAPLP